MFININPDLKLKVTVHAEDPNWVAVVERTTDEGISEARATFDTEPSEAELQDYVTKNYETLEFSKPISPAQKAQEAMKRLLEQRKQQQQGPFGSRQQPGQSMHQKSSMAQTKHKDKRRGIR
jgi:Protein of unknown function (DUF2992)